MIKNFLFKFPKNYEPQQKLNQLNQSLSYKMGDSSILILTKTIFLLSVFFLHKKTAWLIFLSNELWLMYDSYFHIIEKHEERPENNFKVTKIWLKKLWEIYLFFHQFYLKIIFQWTSVYSNSTKSSELLNQKVYYRYITGIL